MKLKILAIGDFHGKFPEKLKRKIKKEKPDLIVSQGDFAGGKFGKELLKYEKKLYKRYGGDFKKLPKEIKKEADEKYAIWNRKALKNSEDIIFYLKKIRKPVYFVHGNWDFFKKERKNLTKKRIGLDELKGNLHFIHRKRVIIWDFVLLGLGGYRVTSVKEYLRHTTERGKIPLEKVIKIKGKLKKMIRNLFRIKRKDKFFIFITHDVPYNTKLDYLKSEKMHIGEKLLNEAIKKYSPQLVICGHMHENQGRCRIGKSLVINPGAASEGKAAIIEIEKNKVKNVRFLK